MPLSPVRRRLLEFVAAIAVLDAAAIALYYALHIPQAAFRTQQRFAYGWMALTLIVVVVGLRRLNAARRAARRATWEGAARRKP